LEYRWAGRALALLSALVTMMLLACAFPPLEKPLNPSQLFAIGSSFLDSAATLAIKGGITFEGGKIVQSGSFQLCLNGRDSLSFDVSGPLGADIFRMVILGDSAYLLSNKDDGWIGLKRGEDVSIEEFGIDHISPFLLGLFAFPQYYLQGDSSNASSDDYKYNNETIISQLAQNNREFMLFESQSRVAAVYVKRKDFENGYYPSSIRIFKPGSEWQIKLEIEKVRLNAALPDQIWKRDLD
jgi:hypothetical protein